VGVGQATRIWLGVLVAAVLSVGVLQQRVDSNQAFNVDRYRVATVLVALLALVLRFIFKATLLASIVSVAVFILLFFGWHFFLGFAVEVGVTGIFRDVLVVGLLATSAAALLMRPRRSIVLARALLLSVGGLRAAAAPYVSWVFVDSRPIEFVSIDSGAEPTDDVLVIVLDAYLRADQLAQFMNFDNSEFAAQLEARGFMVDDDAMSNYNRSYGSVASMMALQSPV
jgi:hypothetical protein